MKIQVFSNQEKLPFKQRLLLLVSWVLFIPAFAAALIGAVWGIIIITISVVFTGDLESVLAGLLGPVVGAAIGGSLAWISYNIQKKLKSQYPALKLFELNVMGGLSALAVVILLFFYYVIVPSSS